MVCKHCGNELRDGAKFCPHCGTAIAAGPEGGLSAPYSTPAAPAWEAPEEKKKSGLYIGIGVAAVAVIAVLAVMLSGLFSNPKRRVEAAFVKSAAAYQAAEKRLDLPDTAQWQKEQKITQSMGLRLESINSDLAGMDLSALNGLALSLFTTYNGDERWMSADLAALWGEDYLLELSMKADDAELYFNSPQLTGSTHYGMNTETLGADLAVRGSKELEEVSFNLFDLVDLMLEQMDQEALEEEWKAAGKSLWDQVKVKKLGARTLDLNGTETKTAAYQITIPLEALERFVDDLETTLFALDYYDLYEQMFQAMGMPLEEIQDFLDELEELDVYGELADGLRDAVDEIGDLELEVCLSGGYVSAVTYEGQVEDSDLTVTLRLGGGAEYVDDLTVEMTAGDLSLTLKSSGDHGLKSGVYTDDTTLRIREGSVTTARLTSEMTLDPASKSNNFTWKLGVDSSGLSVCVLDMAGDVYWGRDQLSLNPVTISVRAVGMEVCTLTLSYHVENHASRGVVEDPRLITQMDENELKQMVLDTQQRALSWASEMENLFLTRLPQELLWAMTGLD